MDTPPYNSCVCIYLKGTCDIYQDKLCSYFQVFIYFVRFIPKYFQFWYCKKVIILSFNVKLLLVYRKTIFVYCICILLHVRWYAKHTLILVGFGGRFHRIFYMSSANKVYFFLSNIDAFDSFCLVLSHWLSSSLQWWMEVVKRKDHVLFLT